jgi:hypothetical protein
MSQQHHNYTQGQQQFLFPSLAHQAQEDPLFALKVIIGIIAAVVIIIGIAVTIAIVLIVNANPATNRTCRKMAEGVCGLNVTSAFVQGTLEVGSFDVEKFMAQVNFFLHQGSFNGTHTFTYNPDA